MGAAAVVLRVESGGTEGSYTFVCPVCEDTIEKRADRKVVMLLLSAGVEVHEVPRTAVQTDRHPHPSQATFGEGLLEAPEIRPEGEPFTMDDLIDFHFLLEADDWLDQVIAAGA